MKFTQLNEPGNPLKVIILLFVLGFILYIGQSILLPLIFSGLLTLLILPIAKFLEKILPRSLASLVTLLSSLAVIFGVIVVLGIQMNKMVIDISGKDRPSKETELMIQQKMEDFTKNLGIHKPEIEKMLNQSAEKIAQGTYTVVRSTIVGIRDALLFFVMCSIYMFFMLQYRHNILAFYLQIFPSKDVSLAPRILSRIKQVLRQYTLGLLLVVIIVGSLTGLGLYILGIDYAIFIGALSGILTLIPFIGVIISALIPLVIAFITKDSVMYLVGVLCIYAVVQFLEGNVITPKILGNQVNVNPLMIIIAVIILGSLVGILGIVLAVPILAVCKVFCDHSDRLKAWRHLLEDKPSI